MLLDLFHPLRVRVGVSVPDKENALLEVASLLTMPEGTVNEESVFDVLMERERLASTGVGSHVAIPHGRIDAFDELRASVAICPEGVDFAAVDALPVNIIGPRAMPEKHLAALAGVSRVLRNDAKRAALIRATSDEEAFRVLTQP